MVGRRRRKVPDRRTPCGDDGRVRGSGVARGPVRGRAGVGRGRVRWVGGRAGGGGAAARPRAVRPGPGSGTSRRGPGSADRCAGRTEAHRLVIVVSGHGTVCPTATGPGTTIMSGLPRRCRPGDPRRWSTGGSAARDGGAAGLWSTAGATGGTAGVTGTAGLRGHGQPGRRAGGTEARRPLIAVSGHGTVCPTAAGPGTTIMPRLPRW